MRAGIDVLADGDAAHQRQRHHVHIAVTEGAHREEMAEFVDHHDHQDHPRRHRVPQHRAQAHEQRDTDREQRPLDLARWRAPAHALVLGGQQRNPCRRHRARIGRRLGHPAHCGRRAPGKAQAGSRRRVAGRHEVSRCNQRLPLAFHPRRVETEQRSILDARRVRGPMGGHQRAVRRPLAGETGLAASLHQRLLTRQQLEVDVEGLRDQGAPVGHARHIPDQQPVWREQRRRLQPDRCVAFAMQAARSAGAPAPRRHRPRAPSAPVRSRAHPVRHSPAQPDRRSPPAQPRRRSAPPAA